MKDDLISRSALIAEFEGLRATCADIFLQAVLDRCIGFVELQPVADAISEGRWEEVEDLEGDIHWRCSLCGDERYLEYGDPWDNGCNCCPGCGSKMAGRGADAAGQ